MLQMPLQQICDQSYTLHNNLSSCRNACVTSGALSVRLGGDQMSDL